MGYLHTNRHTIVCGVCGEILANRKDLKMHKFDLHSYS